MTMTELAQQAGLSVSHVSRLISAEEMSNATKGKWET